MNILLSHSYFIRLDPKEYARKKPYPPLATLTMAGWIKQELDMNCSFHDVQFNLDSTELINRIQIKTPEVVLIYDDDFNYLSKMCLSNMRNAISEVVSATYINRPLFIIHGSDSSDQADYYLNQGFDFVIHKNAEATVIDFFKLLNSGKKNTCTTLEGISYLDNKMLVTNPERKQNLSTDNQAEPAWDLINLSTYREIWQKAHGYFSLNISTSHGCPFNCNWCAKPLYGRVYNSISASKIVEQFLILATKLKADHIWVTDDIFALNPKWLTEFANLIENEQIKTPYTIQSRAGLMNEGVVRDLKRSGCDMVWMGVESGSQKVLDAMVKETTIQEIIEANKLLKKHQVKTAFFLQYGYPGEDMSDIRQTLQLIRRCLPDTLGISVSYPLKGTVFYQTMIDKMEIKQNWTDSGDLEMMFPGKYHPDFYRALHRFTHHYFGIVSLFKKQPLKKVIRRFFALIKHVPAFIYKRFLMSYYIRLSK